MTFIYGMLGAFLVIAAFCSGYWLGNQRAAKLELEEAKAESGDKSKSSTFNHSTPFSRASEKKVREEDKKR